MGNFGGIRPVDPFNSYIGWVRRVEERVKMGISFSMSWLDTISTWVKQYVLSGNTLYSFINFVNN